LFTNIPSFNVILCHCLCVSFFSLLFQAVRILVNYVMQQNTHTYFYGDQCIYGLVLITFYRT
jgi:hypothetical protein